VTKDKKARLTLKELERRIAANSEREMAVQRELEDLRERYRRLEILVGSGVVMMMNDMARQVGFRGGLTVDIRRDYHEFHDSRLGQVHRIPAYEEYNVTYESPDGTTWENGVAVSKEYRKP
jgi:hypothetical protein